MKYQLFFLVMTLCLLTLPAQGQLNLGMKADMTLSNYLVEKSTNLNSSMNVGSSTGFFCKYKWYENRVLEMDVMFRYLTSKFKNQSTSETADFSYFGIEIPVYSMLQADIGDQILYVGLGPFASFGLFSRYESAQRCIDLYHEDPVSRKATMLRWDFGVGLIIGYELKCKLQFNYNYHLGFRNLMNDGFENVIMVSQLNSFGVGYRF